MLGFDHPETLQFEMQLTWVEDTWTDPWPKKGSVSNSATTCSCSQYRNGNYQRQKQEEHSEPSSYYSK